MSKSERYIKGQLYSFVVLICGVSALVFLIFSALKIDFYEFCFPMTVLLFIFCLFLFRNRQPLLFIDFYLFLYFMYLFYYFYQGAQLSEHRLYQKHYLFEKACLLFYLFYYAQFCIYKKYRSIPIKVNSIIRGNKHDFSFMSNYTLLFMAFVLLALTYRIGTDMIRNGFNYRVYIENLKSSSVIPALFVLMFSLYAFSRRANKILCYFFACAYLYFCLSRGFRITALPAFLVIYLAFYEGKIPNMLFLGILFLGLLAILIAGELKDTGSFDFSKLFDTNRGGVIISHHADILYTIVAGFGLSEDGVIDGVLRLCLGGAFFLQAVILPSLFPDTLRFPLVISHFTQNGGGGLFLAGSYLFWGFAGVFISAYLINLLIIKAYDTNSSYFRLAMAMVLVFSCNWISYDFHTILRFPVYTLIVYWFLNHVNWRYLRNEKSISCVAY